MNSKRFNEVFNEQHENRKSILCGKAEEYASDVDRLHNFKVAAAVQELSPLQALAGMMAKHTVSVYDMLWSGKKYPLELWKEKITDSQNYLDLALALVVEEMESEPGSDKIIEKHKQKTCEHEWIVVCAESNESIAVLKCKKCGKKTLRQNEVAK